MTAQLICRDLAFSHGPTPVLAGVDLTVAPGHRIGVVGPNGVGKSTLLRLLAGELTPERGRVERHPPTARVVLWRQELDDEVGETVEQVLLRRTGLAGVDAEYQAATAALAAGESGADDRYALALERYLAIDPDTVVATTLERVGLDPAMADRASAALSGGQRARLGLAVVLASQADVLLLDEPTNDLDLAGLELLERFVVGSDAAMVIVSHDRAFLSRTITGVLEIDEHRRTGAFFDGGWDAYLTERSTARSLASERYATFVEQRQRLVDRGQREREWAHQGVRKATKKASDNDKNIRAFRKQQSEQLAARAARTDRAMERLEKVDKPWEGWELRLQFASGGRSGDRVAELAGAVVRRGTFTLGPLDCQVGYGERVGIVGPNGAGKSTLIGALIGDVALDGGTRHGGSGVVVGRLAQARDRFAGAESLLDAFCAETGLRADEARSTLAKLGLGAEAVARPTSQLSPGERTRTVLAAFQAAGVNLMVLDEPTNHLDLPAIEQLESALDSFDGTVLLVTHDRAFLEAVRLTRRIEVRDGRIVDDEPVSAPSR